MLWLPVQVHEEPDLLHGRPLEEANMWWLPVQVYEKQDLLYGRAEEEKINNTNPINITKSCTR